MYDNLNKEADDDDDNTKGEQITGSSLAVVWNHCRHVCAAGH